MDKLKQLVKDMVEVDLDFEYKTYDCMQDMLFGKFLGKAMPLEFFRKVLVRIWSCFGFIHHY